jgi:hypothetical protein
MLLYFETAFLSLLLSRKARALAVFLPLPVTLVRNDGTVMATDPTIFFTPLNPGESTTDSGESFQFVLNISSGAPAGNSRSFLAHLDNPKA